jgi:hypothetical protein
MLGGSHQAVERNAAVLVTQLQLPLLRPVVRVIGGLRLRARHGGHFRLGEIRVAVLRHEGGLFELALRHRADLREEEALRLLHLPDDLQIDAAIERHLPGRHGAAVALHELRRSEHRHGESARHGERAERASGPLRAAAQIPAHALIAPKACAQD